MKNHTQNVVEKLVPDLSIKKTNFECNSSEMLQSLFLLYVQFEVYKVIKIKVLTTCFYLI